MKRLSALCFVFVVVLAGCTGGGGNGTTTAPSTPTSIGADTPPGVSATGVDTDMLLSAHTAVLSNQSYTVSVEQSTSDSDLSITTQAAAGRIPALVEIESQGGTQKVYATTNGTYELRRSGGERTVRRLASRENASTIPTGEQYIRQALADGTFSYSGTVDRDGQTLHELRADLSDLDREVQDGRPTWFEVSMLVDESGLVHSLSYRLTVERDGTEETLRIQMDLTAVGATTVSEPDWLDEAGTDPNVTTRTLSSDTLGTTLSVSGSADSTTSVSLENASAEFYALSPVKDAGASSLVTMNAPNSVSVRDVRMDYDAERIPGGNASELFVFVYHPDYRTFLPMETAYDPANETVQATRIDPDLTIDGTSPSLNGVTGEYVFVVMHAQTYREAIEGQS